MRTAVVQMIVADGNPTANFAHAENLIRQNPGASLYLLPELWTTGYDHSSWKDTAVNVTPKMCADLQELSQTLRAWIGGSMISTTDNGGLANRFRLFSPSGDAPVHYDKVHLFSPMKEDEYLSHGETTVVKRMDEFNAALSICFDLRFPAMYRGSAIEGADLFLVASEWPHPRYETLRLLARARAVENQAFLLLSNRLGLAADGTDFCGGSMIVAPDGQILADAENREQVIIADIDAGQSAKLRSALAVLSRGIDGID
jgi:predicted amidohydrolase